MEYLYLSIDEDGTVRRMKMEPTDDDLRAVETNSLTLVRIKPFTEDAAAIAGVPAYAEVAAVEITTEDAPDEEEEGVEAEAEEIVTVEWERL